MLEVAQHATITDEPQESIEKRRADPSATTRSVEPVVAHVEDEESAEAGIVDIASILGAPTVTVVQSRL
jgi:hypothetical protein